jgi:heme/copper-type cytochrome/quinol oxidase subunit 2
MKGQLMHRMNYLAVVVAAVAAFVMSSVWYTIFGNAWMELRGIDPATAAGMATPAWKMLFVIAQSLVVAFMLAYFVVHLGISNWKGAVRLGALVWVFPAMILLGSVVHENVPLMLAAIHTGDWLVKLLLMSVILGVWRKGGRGPEVSR